MKKPRYSSKFDSPSPLTAASLPVAPAASSSSPAAVSRERERVHTGEGRPAEYALTRASPDRGGYRGLFPLRLAPRRPRRGRAPTSVDVGARLLRLRTLFLSRRLTP